MAILLHSFALMGLMAPVRISAGSMAPHLLGPHWELKCPDCNASYNIGADARPQAGRTACPRCGAIVLIGDAPLYEGDAVLVDRTAFLFRLPQRWEAVVFRCPEDAKTLCVKRIVGLPGERVSLVDGDIYVNGQLSRKSLPEQWGLRVLVDRDGPSSHWRAQTPDSAWIYHAGARPRYVFDDAERAPRRPRDASPDLLTYTTGTGEPITDLLPYNTGTRVTANSVADLALTGTFRCTGEGMLFIRCGDGGEALWVELDLTSGVLRASPAMGETREVDCPPLRELRDHWRPFDLEVSLVDQQVIVAMEGREWLRHPLAGRLPPSVHPLAVAAQGMRLEIEDLAVWRDVAYTPVPGGRMAADPAAATWRLAEDEYFVVGDNPAISADSRTWNSGAGLRAELIVGRPIRVR